jgi:uncharacterized RDD family membrane protein YckC
MGEVLWYYEEAGKQAGPISHTAMAEAIRGGRLPPGSRVWRAGMAGWQPWEAVAELAALAPPPAGPPPLAAPPAGSPGWGPPPGGAQPGWGPPAGGTAPFPPNSYAADALAAGAPGALYPKAPLGARFAAYLIDSLIALVPAALLGGAAIVSIWGAFADDGSGGSGGFPSPGLLALALAGITWALWYSFTKDGRPNGQSIGKKAMGLMVVHLPTNQPCNRGQSALRALVMAALGMVPYVGGFIEPIVTLAADGGRRLGDKAAATQVIAVGEYRPRR